MRRAAGVLVVLCGCSSPTAKPLVVARAGDVTVSADELQLAAERAVPDRARIAAWIDRLVVDEQLAREARTSCPGAELRARAAARRAAISLLLQPAVDPRAVRAYYDTHAAEFRAPGSVELAHVVVACDQALAL